MFTWICPQCGREVPPSYSECPACAENRQRAAQGLPPVGAEPASPQAPTRQPEPLPPPPPPPAGQYANPPQPPQYAPPQYQQPQYAQPPQAPQWPPQPSYVLPESPRGKGLPAWLVTVLVAVVAVGVIYGAVRLLSNRGNSRAESATAALDQPVAQTDSSSPYAKFVEVTGVRIVEDDKHRPKAQFVVVNHSPAELPDMSLQISLNTSTAKTGDDPLAVFTVKTGGLPANGSKDISAPIKTKLRAYEMPDWQFLRASFAVQSSR